MLLILLIVRSFQQKNKRIFMKQKLLLVLSLFAMSNFFYASDDYRVLLQRAQHAAVIVEYALRHEQHIAECARYRDECEKYLSDWNSMLAKFNQLSNRYDNLLTQLVGVQLSGDEKLIQEFDKELASVSDEITMVQKNINDMHQARRVAEADRAKFLTKK
jgi:hypothetical protein